MTRPKNPSLLLRAPRRPITLQKIVDIGREHDEAEKAYQAAYEAYRRDASPANKLALAEAKAAAFKAYKRYRLMRTRAQKERADRDAHYSKKDE